MVLNSSVLYEYARNAKLYRLDESVNFTANSVFDSSANYDVFISHSFDDRDKVLGLRTLFNQCGYKVYVDWIDDANLDREHVTSDTANVIRERIKQSKSLALIVTSNSSDSKWCPWELGYSDGYNGKTCVLPIFDHDYYKGQEYLGLYPFIDFARNNKTNKEELWVNDPHDSRKYLSLREWLKGEKMKVHY